MPPALFGSVGAHPVAQDRNGIVDGTTSIRMPVPAHTFQQSKVVYVRHHHLRCRRQAPLANSPQFSLG
jgi:hypothetical protein